MVICEERVANVQNDLLRAVSDIQIAEGAVGLHRIRFTTIVDKRSHEYTNGYDDS